jgi:hypothetical protein
LKRKIYAAGILILVMLLVCSFVLPSGLTMAAGGRPETGWNGTWQTSWTIMEYGKFNTYRLNITLSQSGSNITGIGNDYNWKINGTVSGNTLIGAWSADLPPVWDDNTGGYIAAPHTFGQLQITIDPSGASFNGMFKGEYHYNWDDRYVVTGEKLGGAPVTPPADTSDSTPKPAIMDTVCKFTGTWDTEWGNMTLTQNGNTITGNYDYEGGKIQGTVNGNTATGTWSESPSHQPPYDAGDFVFTLTSNCKTFNGYWRFGSCDWEGDIRGAREDITPTPVTTGIWAGNWDSNWGDMALTQNGNQVTGSYTHDSGQIVGTISGNTLSGTWSESPSYTPPNDAGDFIFTLSADGQSFTGDWRYDSTGSWESGGWTGNKIEEPEPEVPDDWNGNWNTDWGMMLLSQNGNQITGNYEYEDGTIEGTVSGNTVTGTWSKAPSYSEPDDAGTFEFIMASDWMSFNGNWKYSACGWSGDWDGILIEPDIDPNPGVNNAPVASFYVAPANPNTNSVIVAVSESYDPDGDKLSFTWSLDGTVNNLYQNNPYSIWQELKAGTHTVSLTVGDGSGLTSSYQVQINVAPAIAPNPSPSTNRPPTASFYVSPQAPTAGQTVIATSTSTDPDGDTLFYSWSLDGVTDSEYDNLPYFIWLNSMAGTHTIRMVVSDGKGGSSPLQVQVTVGQSPQPTPGPTPGVNTPPQAYFTIEPPQPEAGEKIKVISQSTDADGDKLEYVWYLDGQMLSEYTDSASWQWKKPEPGGHVMRLVVDDNNGGSDAVSLKIKIIKGDDSDGGGINIEIPSCFIATAAYGSSTARELDLLRAFRDRVLMKSEPGRAFVEFYYQTSPPIADFIARHEVIRTFVREVMLDPIVLIVKSTQDKWYGED